MIFCKECGKVLIPEDRNDTICLKCADAQAMRISRFQETIECIIEVAQEYHAPGHFDAREAAPRLHALVDRL